MKENTSVLRSEYIIDGIRMDATPEAMLEMACERELCAAASSQDGGSKPVAGGSGSIAGGSGSMAGEAYEPIVDESVDPSPFAEVLDPECIQEYLEKIKALGKRNVPLCYSPSYTNGKIAQALLNAIWMAGHFRLGDLAVSVSWNWNSQTIGSMASLYGSVEAACGYLEAMGVKMADYSIKTDGGQGKDDDQGKDGDQGKNGDQGKDSRAGTMDLTTRTIDVRISLSDSPAVDEFGNVDEGEDFFSELPFRTEHPTLRHTRRCGVCATGNNRSWIIYIPFDPGTLLLGGSALSEAVGKPCGKAPAIDAADYFIDCYEVVRELVEDGIVLSGETVGEGGIMAALSKLVPEKLGFEAEIGGIMKSYGEKDAVRILFSEVPGVLIEISDEDYDYLDAELLLQDVAYYPLGHVTDRFNGIRTTTSDSSDITQILHSLLSGPVSEGED